MSAPKNFELEDCIVYFSKEPVIVEEGPTLALRWSAAGVLQQRWQRLTYQKTGRLNADIEYDWRDVPTERAPLPSD